MVDWNGTTNFALDILGRLEAVSDHNNKITAYDYDTVGNKTDMLYPDGSSVEYVYDLLGRLTNVIDNENQNTEYGYDQASRLTSTAYPNGWNVTSGKR